MSAGNLELALHPIYDGTPLVLESARYQNQAGEQLRFSRLSYLLSGWALQQSNGVWLEFNDSAAWLDASSGRDSLILSNVPAGSYQALRFQLGLPPALNHAAPTNFPATHPLNPNLNGLHWSWQGGYIFLALEGYWSTSDTPAKEGGFAFHLAGDSNRLTILRPFAMSLHHDAKLDLTLDLATIFNGPRPLSLLKSGTSTHSRSGDPIVPMLATNLREAFRIRRFTAPSQNTHHSAKASFDLPAQFTPYRLQLSASFPIPELPADNPLLEERVALGRQLFHEPLLSKDGSISCASCHDARHAMSDTRRYSTGVRGQVGSRNAMPLFNLAWKSSYFWDGRAPTLRAQSLIPIQDHREMDESLSNVVAKLQNPPNGTNYQRLFAQSFNSPEITAERLGLALESFLLTLISDDSKFDRSLRGETSLTPEEKRGLELFMTEYDPRRGQFGADCFHCHGGALFQSQAFANNGLDETAEDSGRAAVTRRAADKGRFATPSLRNVALTAPYMHDGRFATLEEVVDHYNRGVQPGPTLDPNLAKHPATGLSLTAADQKALVAFMRTLTDERWAGSAEQH